MKKIIFVIFILSIIIACDFQEVKNLNNSKNDMLNCSCMPSMRVYPSFKDCFFDYYFNDEQIKSVAKNLSDSLSTFDSIITFYDKFINNFNPNLKTAIWCSTNYLDSIEFCISGSNNTLHFFYKNSSDFEFKSQKLKYMILVQALTENLILGEQIKEDINNLYFGYIDSNDIKNNCDLICINGKLIKSNSILNNELNKQFKNYFKLLNQSSLSNLIKNKITPLTGSSIILKKGYNINSYNEFQNESKFDFIRVLRQFVYKGDVGPSVKEMLSNNVPLSIQRNYLHYYINPR